MHCISISTLSNDSMYIMYCILYVALYLGLTYRYIMIHIYTLIDLCIVATTSCGGHWVPMIVS